MRRWALAAVVSLAGLASGAATAGEIKPSWSGFYAGVNAGYGWDSNEAGFTITTTDPVFEQALADLLASGTYPTSLAPDPRGPTGGIQAGYNWRVDSQLVFGLEGDLSASAMQGSETVRIEPQNFFDGTSTTVDKSIGWLGTVRARIGLLATPDLLLFATGGLAVGQTSLHLSTFDISQNVCDQYTICGDATSSGINAGWVAGVGAEAALSPEWSVKAEYLYYDVGKRALSTLTVDSDALYLHSSSQFAGQALRVGLNYHF